MIIWSGHGILIPLFGLIGLFVGGLIGGMIGGLASGEQVGTGAGMIVGGLLASGLIWLYALTFGKTREDLLVDPKTGKKVLYRRANSFFFIPAFAWAVISSLGAVFMLILGIGVLMSKPAPPVVKGPGAAELDAAEKLILTDSDGVAHGNTPQAREMAAKFSTLAASLRGALIEPGKSSKVSLSGGEFLTYCQDSAHGVAFLVHVPGLRKFTDEAKQAMSEAAWFAANQTVADLDPAPENLAVAVKGVVLYETIMIGVPGATADDPTAGIRSRHRSHESSVLQPYFAAGPRPETEAHATPDPATTTPTAAEPTVEPAPAPSDNTPAPAPATTQPATPAPAPEATPATPPAPAPAPEAAAPALPTETREWKSADGRSLQAALIRFVDEAGTQAEFKREDGQVFTIPVERFDTPTQKALRELHQQVGKP